MTSDCKERIGKEVSILNIFLSRSIIFTLNKGLLFDNLVRILLAQLYDDPERQQIIQQIVKMTT